MILQSSVPLPSQYTDLAILDPQVITLITSNLGSASLWFSNI